MDEIETTEEAEMQCLKDWAPELAANAMFRCLCPRCYPYTFAERQAEMLEQVSDDGDVIG